MGSEFRFAMTAPSHPDRKITLTSVLALTALLLWLVVEYNLLLIAWVGGALGLLLLAVLALAAWRNGLRWLFSRRALRFYAWVAAGLVSVVALFYAEENWRGKRSWAKLQREVAARGESLGLDSVTPAAVPVELNFAAAPGVAAALGIDQPQTNRITFFHGDPHDWPTAGWAQGRVTDLAEWHRLVAAEAGSRAPDQVIGPSSGLPAKDLLRELKQFDPPLEALRNASARPRCRYPINYEEAWVSLSGRLFDNLRNAAGVLRLRACAELQLEDPAAALRDVLLLLRLADTMKEEPFATAHRLRLEMLMLAVQPVWEGLAGRRWRSADLTVLQERFAAFEPRREFQRMANGETILMLHLASQFEAYLEGEPSSIASQAKKAEGGDAIALWFLKAIYPEGWPAQDRVWLYRFYQRYGPSKDGNPVETLDNAKWRTELRRIMDPILPVFVVPRIRMAIDDSITWGRYWEAVMRQVRAGCALERFRLEKGRFPETLAALVPNYLDAVPADPCASISQPMRYQPGKESYRLYSVGADGDDDGGRVSDHQEHFGRGRSLLPRLHHGDWVWTIPAISR